MSDPRPATSLLNDEEWAVLEQAKIKGFYIRSGFRLQPLQAWRQWCRARGQPAIVGIRGARDGRIEQDGQLVKTVPVAQLEVEATRVVAELGR